MSFGTPEARLSRARSGRFAVFSPGAFYIGERQEKEENHMAVRKTIGVILLMMLVLGWVSAADLVAQSDKRVDLNTAGEAELVGLPGIGPSIAKRIVEYRENNGPFEKVEDLMNIRGIGERTFLQIRDLVTVRKEDPQPQTAQ
jgi:comEA protein